MSVSVCVCVCKGAVAREVSSTVVLHLTSILITPFQQRSSSQPLPQSNGLTWEAFLHSSASPDLLLLHTHTHTQRNVESHLTAIRRNQVEADQFCPSNLFRDRVPLAQEIPPHIIN